MQRAAFLPFLALLAACQAAPPPGLPADDVTLVVSPRLATARQVLAVTAYVATDIDHLTITLEKAGTPVGSPLTLTKAADGPLDGHAVTFQHLHKDTVYTLKARAYLADNTPISDDASSQATVSTVGPQPGTSFEDRPTIAAGLPVRLVDRTFDGTARNTAQGTGNGLAVGDGGYLTTAGHAITLGTALTQWVAGNGLAGGTLGANPALLELKQAAAIATDGSGTVYVADAGNHRIVKVDAGASSVLALSIGTLNTPGDLAYGPDGRLYVADVGDHTVKAVDPTTGLVLALYGTPLVTGSADGLLATFSTPGHVTTIGSAGNFKVYVSDVGNAKIRVIDPATGLTSTLVGDGTPGDTDSDDPQANPPRLTTPRGLAADASGNLLIMDGGTITYAGSNPIVTGLHRLRRYDFTTGKLQTLTGIGAGAGYQDGAGPTALFRAPGAIAAKNDLLYVADTGNHVIRQVDLAASPIQVTTLAGSGVAGYREGAYRAARFFMPDGLAVSGSTLYVLDGGNNRLRKL